MQARKRIMDILEKEISDRRRGIATSRVDFLQQLLANEDDKLEKGEITRLTDKEIKDNILTMIIAGKECKYYLIDSVEYDVHNILMD